MTKNKKQYHQKTAELKIESYTNIDQLEKDGKRIGYFKLNLAEYINKGVSSITFKMDKEGSIYLTVKISVVEAN